MLWPCRGSVRAAYAREEGHGHKILEPLTGPVEGLMILRRVKADPQTRSRSA